MTSAPSPALSPALLGLSLFLMTPAFLCVCLYAHNTVREDLILLFSKYGVVTHVRIFNGRKENPLGYGFVTFKSEEQAKQAIQTSRPEGRHIVRNARVHPTASSTAIQAQVAPSLETPVSSRTIRSRLAEGHLGSRCSLRVLPLTPTHRCLRLEWCRARGNRTIAEWNQVIFSDKSRFNLSS
ncbi:transposable element Tcb2 transposase [Trichonephila clavipes]|nr:transposable element Tcb2 transposase [Trichonephila clavipes]